MSSGWAISKTMVPQIREFLADGSTILELGTGEGTRWLANHYKVLSVEHDPKYHVGCSRLFHVPLVKPKGGHLRFLQRFPNAGRWYDPERLGQLLKDLHAALPYDGILIDGPPDGTTRCWMIEYYQLLFDTRALVIVDDINRFYEWQVALHIAQVKSQSEIIVREADQEKAFGIIQ